MVKLSKNNGILLSLLLLGILLVVFISCQNKRQLREGVVFTRYDKSKLFTKPWSKFCIPPPPSCDKNLLEGPASIGSPPIGCLCKGIDDAGDLDTTCNGMDYNHFY